MEITEIINNLKEKFGDKLDVSKVKEMLQNEQGKMPSMSEIIAKVNRVGYWATLTATARWKAQWTRLKEKSAECFINNHSTT